MIRTVRARHEAGQRFNITTGTGHHLAIDDAEGDSAPRPVELLLAGQAGCTALDVASILAKKRQTFTRYEVAVTGEQREESHPHVFQRIDIVHELEGPGLDVPSVRRAIELSATRYCSAAATFSAGPTEVHHRYVVRRGKQLPDESGEVVVTGPNEDVDALGARWAAAASPPLPPPVAAIGSSKPRPRSPLPRPFRAGPASAPHRGRHPASSTAPSTTR